MYWFERVWFWAINVNVKAWIASREKKNESLILLWGKVGVVYCEERDLISPPETRKFTLKKNFPKKHWRSISGREVTNAVRCPAWDGLQTRCENNIQGPLSWMQRVALMWRAHIASLRDIITQNKKKTLLPLNKLTTSLQNLLDLFLGLPWSQLDLEVCMCQPKEILRCPHTREREELLFIKTGKLFWPWQKRIHYLCLGFIQAEPTCEWGDGDVRALTEMYVCILPPCGCRWILQTQSAAGIFPTLLQLRLLVRHLFLMPIRCRFLILTTTRVSVSWVMQYRGRFPELSEGRLSSCVRIQLQQPSTKLPLWLQAQ